MSDPATASKPAFGVSRSFSGRKWLFPSVDDEAAQALALARSISPMLAQLLLSRGVKADEAESYLQPTLKNLMPDPFVLADMEKAVTRVAKAIERGEKIAVLGDYDVDGSCSSALVSDFLGLVAERPRLYVPDRMTEGYGPSVAAMRKLKDEGISLVITVDCGAGAVAALTEAESLGLDVVILDHHAVENPPPAFAHVNPNRPGDSSVLNAVSAAGISFLFLVALNRALRAANWYSARNIKEPDLREALDIVALATICDVVPLSGLNRAFVRAGLARLQSLERPGLAALASVAQTGAPFKPYHLGFVFGPRINAGGRVGRCSLGAELLTTTDPAKAAELAAVLDRHNRERQAIEKLILEEAIAMAAEQDNWPFLFVAADGWHPGVVGIVAGRLKDRFAKPAFVAGFEGGYGRGSARSVPGVNVGAVIRAAREAAIVDTGGGHAMAAGFSLQSDRRDEFREHLLKAFSEAGAALDTANDLLVETVVAPSGATEALIDDIARAGPFGAGNAEPIVVIPDVIVDFADTVGKDHVRLGLRGGDGKRIDAIAFRAGETALGKGLLAARGRKIHAAGRLSAEVWQGRTRVRLQVEDAAAAGV